MDIGVQHKQKSKYLVLTVYFGGTGSSSSLLTGERLRLYAVGSLDYLLDKYGEIFVDVLGTINSFTAKSVVALGHPREGHT